MGLIKLIKAMRREKRVEYVQKNVVEIDYDQLEQTIVKALREAQKEEPSILAVLLKSIIAGGLCIMAVVLSILLSCCQLTLLSGMLGKGLYGWYWWGMAGLSVLALLSGIYIAVLGYRPMVLKRKKIAVKFALTALECMVLSVLADSIIFILHRDLGTGLFFTGFSLKLLSYICLLGIIFSFLFQLAVAEEKNNAFLIAGLSMVLSIITLLVSIIRP